MDVEVQQYITIREILTPSPEISTELLHQSDLLFEDELLTIYSKSKVPTLWTMNLLWISTGINKARVFSVELFQFTTTGDFSAHISTEGINQ